MLKDEIEKVLEELIDITKGSHISDEDWIKREISQALTRILELVEKCVPPVEVSEMTQEEFIRRKLELGYINFTVFGYTISELREIIYFAKSKEFKPSPKSNGG